MANRVLGLVLVLACASALSCGSASAQPAGKPKGGGTGAGSGKTGGTTTTTPTTTKTGGDKPAAPLGPTREKAQALREGADLLEKAQNALDGGNKNLAEQLFSTAELLVGADALADLADQFRAGAPPRVTTPTVKVEDTGPQAKAVGSSEEDDAEAKPEKGSLTGTLQLDGKAPGDALAFVTLEPTSKKWKARKAKERVMEQRDRQFGPRLMLIPVGSKVTFPNFDKVFHNVFSTSASAAFDLGLYKEGQSRDVTFTKEGIIRIGCNLHANMSATIVVIAAPHYVFTKDDGSFAFKSLAPGKYKLRAWSEKSEEPITQEVTIKAGANTVSVGVAADSKGITDKFGVPRGKKK
jgi:plastocyanin